ncbi:hypothetical protein [Desulfohalovibrio reitneri]|uniref:hypothetical protein n=1 Tax=Desulfohalovibrio reitneri TaxID=1307759 RepID=UPI0004A6C7CC|nr:hypothetical protein [Desulfohalovibrio reitneri]
MTILLVVALLSALLIFGLLACQRLHLWSDARTREIKAREARLTSRLEEAMGERRELERQLRIAEQNLSLVLYRLSGLESDDDQPRPARPARTAGEIDERAGSWLLRQGHLSIEQLEKASKLVGKTGQDLLETCLILGYISKEAAKEAARAAYS